MVKNLILQYYPYVLVVTIILYLLFKSYLIVSRKLTEDFMFLIMNSFKQHSKQALRNTFNEGHKRFFERSNSINTFFFMFILGISIVYGIMYSIS